MRITDVKVHVVSVPFTTPETWRYGRLWGLTSAVVEVETDEGITGIGETNGSPLIKLVVAALEANAKWLIGEDPRLIKKLTLASRDRGWHHYPHIGNMALGALEMALWDISGKACQAPVHQLLGGLLRDHVPFYWYITAFERSAEGVRKEAAAGIERGFETMYMKIGFDLAEDVELTRAIREEVGADVEIRVDPNEGWSTFEARRALEAFGELGVEFVEEPIDMNDRRNLAWLRRNSATRVGANQSAWLAHHALEVIERNAADVVVTDPHQLGGLGAFRDVCAMCEIAGIPVIKHAFADMGITTAASLHVLGTLSGPVLAHQQFVQILEHDLLTEPLEFRDGGLDVPSGPGLGIELDRKAIEHYGRLYREYGEFEGYSPGFDPSPIPDHELRGRS